MKSLASKPGQELHAILHISLPLLPDYDVKMPNFTFHGGRKPATLTTKFSYSF